MKVLTLCEYSGIVRDAFSRAGHDAWSCDLLPTESELTRQEDKHLQCDALTLLYHPWELVGVLSGRQYSTLGRSVKTHNGDGSSWDLIIAFPPCTYLSYAGNRHWNAPGRLQNRLDALRFFADIWLADVPRICIENPMGCANPTIASYAQIIQPYQFGDPYIKRTCLWLKGLPVLLPTHNTPPVGYHVDASSGKKRRHGLERGVRDQHERSRFWPGIADAMAKQWGGKVMIDTKDLPIGAEFDYGGIRLRVVERANCADCHFDVLRAARGLHECAEVTASNNYNCLGLMREDGVSVKFIRT
ncbi:MAG: hypothetical protein LBH06_00800 [Rikenellaceae bacterium]|jgi:hypothetical protein|nr:hypothetical protein [Rikenellaceae bacterium]